MRQGRPTIDHQPGWRGSKGFDVTLLFEADGIRVYRFVDCGHYHYFASSGTTMGRKMQDSKTARPEEITTVDGLESVR